MLRSSSLLLFLSFSAMAADFVPPKTANTNLIRESETLAVLKEQSVQVSEDNSRRIYSVLATSVNAEKLTINSNENRITYPVSSSRGAIGAQWGYLPFQYHGYFGVGATAHYSYMEANQVYKTALHWVMAELHLLYRYEPSRRTLFKPFAGAGGGSHVFVQRGPIGYDTSEAQGIGSALLGVAWNLSHTFSIDSPLLWELTAQYKRVFAQDEELMNLNGDHFSLGLELAL